MAKARTTSDGSSKGGKSKPTDGMTDLRIRIDSQIHQKIKDVAEQSEISINQLVCGILEAVIEKTHLGAGTRNKAGGVISEQRAKCVFVGDRATFFHSDDENSGLLDAWNEHHDENKKVGDMRDSGQLWFTLDYSGRPVRYG